MNCDHGIVALELLILCLVFESVDAQPHDDELPCHKFIISCEHCGSVGDLQIELVVTTSRLLLNKNIRFQFSLCLSSTIRPNLEACAEVDGLLLVAESMREELSPCLCVEDLVIRNSGILMWFTNLAD